jgi:uncharacterized membrane protein YfhO
MIIKTIANRPSVLVTSDVYYPGWKATIDNKSAEIFVTDYLLRGVVVPEGPHIVKFKFKPKRFYLGAAISGAAAFGLLLAVTIWARKLA